MNLEKLKYPIGAYISNKNPSNDLVGFWIKEIEEFPFRLEALTNNISAEELNYKYRPNGWTVKQVIHHCADSHMNSIIRFKLALTENTPIIRPYFEDKWAELTDSKDNNITDSMLLLKGLHAKWSLLLKNLSAEQLKLEFVHPEHGTKFNLAENIGNYAWHCNHHFAHVKNGIESLGRYQ